MKPPRAVANSTAVQNFGNVLGELRLNLNETISSQDPPGIGFIEVSPGTSMSPPQRHAPPPPRPPPPAGWKQHPVIPERIQLKYFLALSIFFLKHSFCSRPLPSLPIDVSLTPVYSEPSTSSPSSTNCYENHNSSVVENPLYLSLDTYRSISGITPSPSNGKYLIN